MTPDSFSDILESSKHANRQVLLLDWAIAINIPRSTITVTHHVKPSRNTSRSKWYQKTSTHNRLYDMP